MASATAISSNSYMTGRQPRWPKDAAARLPSAANSACYALTASFINSPVRTATVLANKAA
jgi:hypothetical protein